MDVNILWSTDSEINEYKYERSIYIVAPVNKFEIYFSLFCKDDIFLLTFR